VQVNTGSGQTAVNGNAMILLIAITFSHLVGAEPMNKGADDFWRSVEVLNCSAIAQRAAREVVLDLAV
jgi:hypothetical protein